MISEIQVKSILNKKKQRDSWFLDEYTVNAYQGCSMNCLYCYVRGSKYGVNMAERLSVKINAPEILEKQLQYRVKKNQYGFIVLSSATDPYMPVDEKYEMTQKFLQLFLKYRFPVHIITKSNRILQDVEILKQIDAAAILPDDLQQNFKHGLIISFSVSSLDANITQHLEPGSPFPLQRLETMQKLKENGLFTGLNYMPLLPFISDSAEKIDEMVAAAKNYGARYVLASGLTLFGENAADSKTLYLKFIERYQPHLLAEYKKMYALYPFPSQSYQAKINALVNAACTKYNMKNQIL